MAMSLEAPDTRMDPDGTQENSWWMRITQRATKGFDHSSYNVAPPSCKLVYNVCQLYKTI